MSGYNVAGYTYGGPKPVPSGIWSTLTYIPKYLWSWITFILDYVKNFICAGTFWSYLVLLGLMACTITFASLYFSKKSLTPTCPACPNASANKLMSGPVMITSV